MNYITYTTKEPTRWDTLATKYYGNCFKTQEIIKANPSIPITGFIAENTTVFIPIIENMTTSTSEDLPPWKT